MTFFSGEPAKVQPRCNYECQCVANGHAMPVNELCVRCSRYIESETHRPIHPRNTEDMSGVVMDGLLIESIRTLKSRIESNPELVNRFAKQMDDELVVFYRTDKNKFNYASDRPDAVKRMLLAMLEDFDKVAHENEGR